jgi:ABC-2 type transport system permease protein
MKKYFTVFKTSWANELEYRFAFVLSRFRNLTYLLMLYYVWLNLSQMTGRFAMYSAEELTTYVFLAHLLRAIIFGAQARLAALEINDGTFSTYLMKPVSHFWFIFWRELAQKTIYFVAAIFELAIFIFLTKAHFLWQDNLKFLAFFALATLGSLFLYFLLTYLVSLLAFWSREAMGPRFLFEWFMEFASGAFFPLDILSKSALLAFQFLPFAYIMYFPLKVYLGQWDLRQMETGLSLQIIFIIIFSAVVSVAWRRGLRRYSGEGI